PVPGAAGMPGASPGLAIPTDIPPFRFQPRRIGVDWRRFSAVDVERVAREVDVAALQEHIAGVTFCDLDGERCPHCGQPADPVLLKVLRMAQLSIEYLLHCQDRLGTSLAVHVQRLQAARAELARTQQQAAEQATQLRGAKEESRRWKKLVATQQLLLRAGPNAYCKVPWRWKGFGGGKRVPMQDALCCICICRLTKQVEQMEDEVEELKAKLRETQQRLEAEREAEKLRREQEVERARQREEEGRRDLERWKEEERRKLHEEIDGLRQLFLAALKDVASRNSAMEGKLQELQAREVVVSNLGILWDDDTEEAWGRTPSWAELRGERGRMAVQVSSAVPMSSPLTPHAGGPFGWRWFHIHALLCGSALWTRKLSLHRGMWSAEGNQLLALGLVGPTSPKRRRVPLPPSHCVAALVPAPAFTPGREEAALGGKRRLLEALRKNPNLLKRFRPILEEVLEEKLESMGVKRVAKGISARTYKSLQALVRLQQQQKAEKFPGLLQLRDELVQVVMRKVRQCKKPGGALPRQVSVIPGTATSTMGRLLERRLDAVTQRPPGGVKLFP
ncbi:DZI1L protein, partial [Himantopus himantopus]|nr:DZI1L protein [Himantopus himantopus]